MEEGQSSQRKVQSWTWKCPKPLVDLTEEAEQSRSRSEPEMDEPSEVGLGCKPDKGSGWTETGVVTSGVKSGSTLVGGPVKSGQKRMKEKGRGLDKGLVQPELRPIGFNDKGVER